MSSNPLHPSPACMWILLINCRPHFWSSHLPSLSVSRNYVPRELSIDYRPLVWSSIPFSLPFPVGMWSCWLITDLLSDHPLCPSPGRMWICWLIADLSSNHPIPSSSHVTSGYVKLLIDCRPLIWSSHHPFCLSPLVSRKYMQQCQTCPLIAGLLSDYPISSSLAWVFRKYVNLSIDHRPLVWSPHPILFVHVQNVCEVVYFTDLSFDHPLHPSPGSMWHSLVIADLMSDHLIFIPFQEVQWTCRLFANLLSDHPIPSLFPSPVCT